MISIVCFYWDDRARDQVRRTKFTAEDVRIWDRMVARNVTIAHRRICITHLPNEIDFMEVVPNGPGVYPDKHVPGTCTQKLIVHRPDIESVLGNRICLLDLDCIVTGNLDPILSREEQWLGWRNPNFEVGGDRAFYQGSFQLFTAGSRSFLWSDFDPLTSPVIYARRFGGAEQAWISERLNTAWPEPGWAWNEPYLTEEDGVYGVGRIRAGKMGNGVRGELPANARLVFTPGDRKPGDPALQRELPWIKEYWH